jgi:hypothetical protein
MNPEIVLTSQGTAVGVTLQRALTDPSVRITTFTAEELQGTAPVPSYKQADFQKLTAKDKRSILSMDPFLNGTIISGAGLDPARFRQVGMSIQLNGPDNPGDTIPGITLSASDTQTQGSISGWKSDLEVDFSYGPDFKAFGFDAQLKGGQSWEWEHENTTESTNGTGQSISGTLSTSTLQHHDIVDVYEDSALNSFAFVVEPTATVSPWIDGTVLDAAGRRCVRQRVVVTDSTGKSRLAVTNAQGVFRVWGMHGTLARMTVGAARVAPAMSRDAQGTFHTSVRLPNVIPTTTTNASR